MKTVFDKNIQNELISRIENITLNSQRQWGKMTVHEMVKHGIGGEEMFQGDKKIKRAFIGYLLGKIILKQALKNEAPFKKNSPTSADLLTKEINTDFEADKKIWIEKIKQYNNFNNPDFVHPFFGKLTKTQVGQLAYKHIDHHLRQFNS